MGLLTKIGIGNAAALLFSVVVSGSALTDYNDFQRANGERIFRVTGESKAIPDGAVGIIFERTDMVAIPPVLAGNKNLQMVKFRGGAVTIDENLVAALGSLDRLTYLAFEGATLRGDIRYLRRLSALRHLRFLRVAGAGLLEIPDDLAELSQLDGLDLSINRLRTVPRVVSRMPSLRMLALSNNQIQRVGTDVQECAGLEFLDLSDNCITAVDGVLPEKLSTLDLSRNKLREIPRCVRDMKNIRELLLQDNYIARIDRGELPSGNVRITVASFTHVDAPTSITLNVVE